MTFAVIPAENASGVTERYTPFVDYLSKELGIKVTLRVANDYAAVIEGQRAGNIHIGYYGPASFARARVTGVQDRAVRHRRQCRRHQGLLFGVLRARQQPLQEDRGPEGQEPRPGRSQLDLRQQHAALRAEQDGHRSRDLLLARSIFTGSHENAVLALAQGTVDVAANWWNADDDSNLTRMLTKGMLKKPTARR